MTNKPDEGFKQSHEQAERETWHADRETSESGEFAEFASAAQPQAALGVRQ